MSDRVERPTVPEPKLAPRGIDDLAFYDFDEVNVLARWALEKHVQQSADIAELVEALDLASVEIPHDTKRKGCFRCHIDRLIEKHRRDQ